MQVSEYRVTMVHDDGTIKIETTASSASAAVDAVVNMERAPRRAARLVETRPLAYERIDNDTWRPVPGDQWGRVDDQPVNVDVHTNPFAPDPENAFRVYSSEELETAACEGKGQDEMREELSRREDVDKAVELWERLCSLDFVRGETQGYYPHSTAHLSPEMRSAFLGSPVHRMPDTAELEALVLSDGEETAYPSHDVDLLAMGGGAMPTHLDSNPWSGDDRLYPITLTLITCGDYHGSDVDAANNRALQGTPGVEVREPNTGGMASVFNVSTTVVGEMSSFINNQSTDEWERDPAERRADALEWLESLVTRMEGLTDYPLLNDETHSELVDELAEQAWDSWLESDVFDKLRELAPMDDDVYEVDRVQEDENVKVQTAYYGYGENDWIVPSLGEGATNGRHADAVKHVARTVFGWNVP